MSFSFAARRSSSPAAPARRSIRRRLNKTLSLKGEGGEQGEPGGSRNNTVTPTGGRATLRRHPPLSGRGKNSGRNMMARHLKRGMDATAIKAADAKVRETVEKILADIDARKDAAVRDLSRQFDNWSPTSFKLAQDEIERAIGQVRKRDLDDIKFAQAQVRNFAQKQKETLRDLEAETLPGVVLGHRHIPVNSIGCYVPGGRYPMVASAHMSIVTARVAGV